MTAESPASATVRVAADEVDYYWTSKGEPTLYKTVITYGTFDLFHTGHLNLIKRLANMAENVIVGVSTDEFNLGKGKKTVIPYEQRAEIVGAIRYVTNVIPEMSWAQKRTDIQEYAVDLFAIGADWEGEFDDLKEYCDVIYLPRTDGVSTTQLKNSLKSLSAVSADDLTFALEVLTTLKNDFE